MPYNLSPDWEMDDSSWLPLPPPLKRIASDLEENSRPNKCPKTNGLEPSSHQSVVTAMDWNSGASPLESWLNQSAIPSIVPRIVDMDERPSQNDLIKQEEGEIKAFRSVHIKITRDPPSTDLNFIANEDFVALSLGAQVHYRIIKDKYPLLPSYLARRLAKANLERAGRLRQQKLTAYRSSEANFNAAERPRQKKLRQKS